MKFSIVTISFNQAAFLERAICSVLRQDHPDIEYIVVDPGSTDGSREIIEKYTDRITTVFEPDTGPADGLNNGFAKATGDVLGYINADDFLLPGALSGAVAAFNRHPKADVLVGDGYLVDPNGKSLKRVRSTPYSPWWFVYGGVMVLQQSTFFKRQAFLDVGGFNIENRTSWDAELVLDMAITGKSIRVVHEDWSAFTLQPDSITGSQRLAEKSALQHALYFQKVKGRDRTPLDWQMKKLGRLRKFLVDPMGLVHRIKDSVAPQSRKLDDFCTPPCLGAGAEEA